MPLETDDGIVLRLSEFSESSQVVTLLGQRCGKLRLLAKGARKSTRTRFVAGLDLLERGHVGFSPARSDGLGVLTEWRQSDAYSGLRRSALGLQAGLYFIELVAALTEDHDPHPRLFDGLAAALTAQATLAAAPSPPRLAGVVAFQWLLLREIGLQPTLRNCVNCRFDRFPGQIAYFSTRAGGLLCRDCEMLHPDKRAIPPSLLAALRSGATPPLLLELLDDHLRACAGRAFATAGPLRTAARQAGVSDGAESH